MTPWELERELNEIAAILRKAAAILWEQARATDPERYAQLVEDGVAPWPRPSLSLVPPVDVEKAG